MRSAQQLEHDLEMFTGTEKWYRHFSKLILFTDGIKFMADNASAYWLVDEIAFFQAEEKVAKCPAQFWELNVNKEDNSAVLLMREDKGQPAVVKKEIPYTDFPLEHQRLWLFINKDEEGNDQRVLILPSEY